MTVDFGYFSDFYKAVNGVRPTGNWTEAEINAWIASESTPEAIARQVERDREDLEYLLAMELEEQAAAEQYRKDTEMLGYPGEKYEEWDPVMA